MSEEIERDVEHAWQRICSLLENSAFMMDETDEDALKLVGEFIYNQLYFLEHL